MKNLNLKVFSILIALILTWFVHSESNTTVRTFVAAVELRQIPNGRVVVSPLNPSAQVTVRGPSFIVSRIPSSPPVFTVSFPDNSERRYKAQLDPNTLPLPPHVEILNVDPPEIDFTLDAMIQRELPVMVPRIGALDESLRVVSITVDPEKVTGRGPASELKEGAGVETEPLDLRNLHKSEELSLPIRNSRQLTRLGVERVTVRVQIAPILSERKFAEVPLEVRAGAGERVSVEPNTVSVELSGPKGGIAAVKRNEIVAFVRVADADTASGEVTVGVDTPPGLSVVSIDPQKVKIVQLAGARGDAAKGTAVKKGKGAK